MMAGNGSVPAYLQADLAAGLPAVRLSPEVERLLYESAGPSGSSNPLGGLPASPPRPPTSASAAAPSSPTDALASRSAGLPRPGSSSALPLGAGGPNATAPLPSASAAGAATGARSAQPMAGAAQPPVKESRRTVLSHDEEARRCDPLGRPHPRNSHIHNPIRPSARRRLSPHRRRAPPPHGPPAGDGLCVRALPVPDPLSSTVSFHTISTHRYLSGTSPRRSTS